MKEKLQSVAGISIFSLAFIIFGFILSSAWRNHTASNETINVTGSAKKDIISDYAILRGSLNSFSNSASDAFHKLEAQKPALLGYLNSFGFTKDKVKFLTVSNNPVYEIGSNGVTTNTVIGYSYSQRLEIPSNDVQIIKRVSLEIASLVDKGVSFTIEQPEYYYTKLAQIKIDIQAEAAKDALVRAQKIAESTNSKIGSMRNAKMGILQITPKNSNMVTDMGINDVSSIEKEITAVVNASFEIK